MTIEKLIEHLKEWDRKHIDHLEDVINQESIIPNVLTVYQSHRELEHATTWIIKNSIDRGAEISTDQLETIFSHIDTLDYWESQLHILQLIPNVKLAPHMVEIVYPWIQKMILSEKKFVKAAAYQAYHEIVKLKPELRPKLVQLCYEAMDKESASIKSKVRKIITSLEK